MNVKNSLNVLATIAMVAMVSTIVSGLSAVQGQEDNGVLTFIVDQTPNLQYSYQEMSNLLNNNKSYEDLNGINLIYNGEVYVFGNHGANGNYVIENILTLA